MLFLLLPADRTVLPCHSNPEEWKKASVFLTSEQQVVKSEAVSFRHRAQGTNEAKFYSDYRFPILLYIFYKVETDTWHGHLLVIVKHWVCTVLVKEKEKEKNKYKNKWTKMFRKVLNIHRAPPRIITGRWIMETEPLWITN